MEFLKTFEIQIAIVYEHWIYGFSDELIDDQIEIIPIE